MKKALLILFVMVVVAGAFSPQASAVSLKVQPLLYNETLSKGEKKKGFIDISNPLGKMVTLQTSVQAFRQTDDNGSLEFYDNQQVKAGILLDLDEFELGPREAIRMYFLIDGTKLPSGDVFAAIFVSTKANQESRGVAESVRLGTLLTLVNGTPGSREASITSLSASFFNFGKVEGIYKVKNTAHPKSTTGFYPEVTVQLTPFSYTVQSKSPLVMAGKSRTSAFSMNDDRFGLYKLTVSHGSSQQSRWVFVVAGYWQWLAPLILIATAGVILMLRAKYYKSGYFRAS